MQTTNQPKEQPREAENNEKQDYWKGTNAALKAIIGIYRGDHENRSTL